MLCELVCKSHIFGVTTPGFFPTIHTKSAVPVIIRWTHVLSTLSIPLTGATAHLTVAVGLPKRWCSWNTVCLHVLFIFMYITPIIIVPRDILGVFLSFGTEMEKNVICNIHVEWLTDGKIIILTFSQVIISSQIICLYHTSKCKFWTCKHIEKKWAFTDIHPMKHKNRLTSSHALNFYNKLKSKHTNTQKGFWNIQGNSLTGLKATNVHKWLL